MIWKGNEVKQKWFIVKFIGEEKEINLNTDPSYRLKWVLPDDLPKVIVDFKKYDLIY